MTGLRRGPWVLFLILAATAVEAQISSPQVVGGLNADTTGRCVTSGPQHVTDRPPQPQPQPLFVSRLSARDMRLDEGPATATATVVRVQHQQSSPSSLPNPCLLTANGRFRYQLGLKIKSTICGATLIRSDVALTAAHCLYPKAPANGYISVIAGAWGCIQERPVGG